MSKTISERKSTSVKDIREYAKKYKVIGIANMEGLPAPQLQKIRQKLKEMMVIYMAKKTLLSVAFSEIEKEKPGISSLKEHFMGMPALIFSNDNPFKICNILDQNKTSAPAKGGQTARNDILIKSGPTSFAPGPIIGELGKFKIKTGVDGGKLLIKDDVTVAHPGDVISAELASLLTRMGIQPMEVGVNVVAFYEDGIIYSGEVLKIRPEAYINQISLAATDSLKLALGINYLSKDTIKHMIQRSHADSLKLAVGRGITNKDTIDIILAMANAQGLNLKDKMED